MSIARQDVPIVKKFLELGLVEIRHINNMPPMYYAVSDKIFNATVEKMEGGTMIQTLLTNTEPAYVRHFASVFEELWSNGMDAAEWVCEIEQGLSSETELVFNPGRAERLYRELVAKAEQELLLIVPTANAFARQKRIGVFDLIKQAASARGVAVRVLAPDDERVKELLELPGVEVR
ncbi:MAG: hypothetical protein C4292_00855, partial [Nitrososphaera sp.]